MLSEESQGCRWEGVDAPGRGDCLTLPPPVLPLPPTTVTARAQLETALKCTNYEKKFRLLLHLEELQMEYDIRHYDLESVPMTLDLINQNPRLLTLEVRAGIGGWDVGSARRLWAEHRSCRQGKAGARAKLFVPKKSARAGRWEGLACSPDFAATSRVTLGKSLAFIPLSEKHRAGLELRAPSNSQMWDVLTEAQNYVRMDSCIQVLSKGPGEQQEVSFKLDLKAQ